MSNVASVGKLVEAAEVPKQAQAGRSVEQAVNEGPNAAQNTTARQAQRAKAGPSRKAAGTSSSSSLAQPSARIAKSTAAGGKCRLAGL